MKISEARELKSGMLVRTDKGTLVRVKQPRSLSQTTTVHKNMNGDEYLWVGTSDGVWPSSRLIGAENATDS